MIETFRHKGLKELFETGNSRGVMPPLAGRIIRLLDRLHAAKIVQDMSLPGFDLHPLKGDRRGTWSVKVSGNWRITFRFDRGDAHGVDLEDYH